MNAEAAIGKLGDSVKRSPFRGDNPMSNTELKEITSSLPNTN